MKSGYKIKWTDNALTELEKIYQYLEENWTSEELNKLSLEIERTVNLISNYPNIFPVSERKNIRKVIVKRFNTLYYREKGQTIEILSFFSNRQSPEKRLL
ncbi:MAG: type II toxin-antitoxin system RelE/ParE family toxin [Bacteroidales bacterium]|nr:type II toxin-antitoxin system RelE/ParE family toxin [Bacteroidales bacterium]